MRPAIGGFHIFPALCLVVMPLPYITEITPEMQQKIKIFAEKGVPAPQKSKSAQAFLLQKSIPAAPLQGAGIRAAGRPPYRRASEPPVRFGGSAAGSAARPALRTTPPPHARGGMCEGRTIGGSSLCVLSGQGLPLCTRYALPPAPAKKTPFGVFFAGAADGN